MSESRLPRDVSRVIRICERVLETGDDAQKLTAAATIKDVRLAQMKVAPLKAKLMDRVKELRALRQERDHLAGELATANGRVAELENSASDLIGLRDHLKDDLSRLGESLQDEKRWRVSAESDARKAKNQAEAAEGDAARLRLSLETLSSLFKADEDNIVGLFFKHGAALAPEAYIGLGWTAERLDKWQKSRGQYDNASNDALIELLHRKENCVCTQENSSLRKPTDELATFLRALLWHRGVDADSEITKLVAKHRDDWYLRNRVTFSDPPLSGRRITYLPRPLRWDE